MISFPRAEFVRFITFVFFLDIFVQAALTSTYDFGNDKTRYFSSFNLLSNSRFSVSNTAVKFPNPVLVPKDLKNEYVGRVFVVISSSDRTSKPVWPASDR